MISATIFVGVSQSASADAVDISMSSVQATADGTVFTVTNHLVKSSNTTLAAAAAPAGTAEHHPHEWLLVWAGDTNVADTTGADIQRTPLQISPIKLGNVTVPDALPGPDFLAVIDADKTSPTYGKVVNTATVGPLVENEPHHMQYIYHKGDQIFAGGLFSAATYVFDVKKLPALSLSGVTLPVTPPVVPCRTLIGTRVNASCANPHGIQLREDLNRMVTSDYAEPRDIILDPVKPPSPYITRNTVRTWDISDRNAPKLVSVSELPNGPRHERNPAHEESNAVMETTVTNLPNHRGAFAETMCGGAVYYTPDITDPKPVWREVFDDTTAAKVVDPTVTEGAGCDGAGLGANQP
jgi:hypothetical protein